jgi:purine-nucleoside phosphorylase
MTEAACNSPNHADLLEAARTSPPQVAVVLGSGMSAVVRRLAAEVSVSFAEVPGLAAPTVAGHQGRLALGDWAGRRVLVFEGRLHHYERHSWNAVVAPVSLAHSLGARVLLLTNAAGGIGDEQVPGSLMAITDHVEWTRPHCWKRPGPGGLGPPRPSPYAPRLVERLLASAREAGVALRAGIYAAMTGPSYETPAEIRALKVWGADAVGMSTAREIQAGADLGLECAAISLITNRAAGLSTGIIHHGEVLATAAGQIPRLTDLLEHFLEHL